MKVRTMVLAAILTALVTVVTAFTPISLGNLGYLNLGDIVILTVAGLMNPLVMIFIAGVGAALADLILAYNHYIIFSFFIKAAEGFAVAYLIQKLHIHYLLGFIVGVIIMTSAYALVDFALFSSIIVFRTSLLYNLGQGLLALIGAALLYPTIKKHWQDGSSEAR